MKRYDFHIHTEFSYDSRIKGVELLQKAIDLQYDEIAITEHLDLLPQELSIYGLPSLSRYCAYIAKLQRDFPAITLHCGIEIGDYHLVKEFAKPLIESFELFPILGSVHFLKDHTNVAILLSSPLTKAQVIDYYENNLRLVSECDIDVLAHLGVYKRYYTEAAPEDCVLPLITEIFRVMIQRNIALELNFSSLRKAYQSVIPEPQYIDLYRSLGGNLFSLGSDAHRIDHFGITRLAESLIGEHDTPIKRVVTK
ncbi:MAG: histidinol-phosphatase HisJ family protein [Candidatus Cloacimonetes bacterium]|nr:histidinol-phosphatase HisJ family protein [Candidatus Cloacimonadota bacterium]MCK9334431.1 histidinol-phosphatase HisJ family protein [Candidatus Cloacimonadota bacterium]MDD2542826.1 histidinol-phosphatase HisJ family protein [Candidatus Cloacimonadota bacterium]MDD2683392.1 histidinol-phosphatase HisJ family protein [Candidatus Cloacimonadota bacterium]MDD3096106.1 histidinol-phosphatase HisJ family protein [Candidatus Cloacimonadota bacterium]